MNSAVKPRRSFSQFSLRELLLLITTAAAVIGLAVSNLPRIGRFQPTQIAVRLKDMDQVRAVCKQLGHDQSIRVDEDDPFWRSVPIKPESAFFARDVELALPPELQPEFIKTLEKEIISVIEAEADAIVHGGQFRRGHDLYSFETGYVKGATNGRLFVYLVGNGQEQFELFMLIHEHDTR